MDKSQPSPQQTHFQFDVDERGKVIKICSIVDEHTRVCLGVLVERSITAERFISHLDEPVAEYGASLVLPGQSSSPMLELTGSAQALGCRLFHQVNPGESDTLSNSTPDFATNVSTSTVSTHCSTRMSSSAIGNTNTTTNDNIHHSATRHQSSRLDPALISQKEPTHIPSRPNNGATHHCGC